MKEEKPKRKWKVKRATCFLRKNLHATEDEIKASLQPGWAERHVQGACWHNVKQIKQYCSEFWEKVARSIYFEVSTNSTILHLKSKENPSRNSIYITVPSYTFFPPSLLAVSEHSGWYENEIAGCLLKVGGEENLSSRLRIRSMPPHAWETIHVKQGNTALAQNR